MPLCAAAGKGEQPLDSMNSIAANLLLHLTASGAAGGLGWVCSAACLRAELGFAICAHPRGRQQHAHARCMPSTALTSCPPPQVPLNPRLQCGLKAS